jgi:hypothetical protein
MNDRETGEPGDLKNRPRRQVKRMIFLHWTRRKTLNSYLKISRNRQLLYTVTQTRTMQTQQNKAFSRMSVRLLRLLMYLHMEFRLQTWYKGALVAAKKNLKSRKSVMGLNPGVVFGHRSTIGYIF